MEINNAAIGIKRVLLDFKEINIIRIKILAKNIIQNPNPKNAVHTNIEGFMKGHRAQSSEKNNSIIPPIPITDFPNP